MPKDQKMLFAFYIVQTKNLFEMKTDKVKQKVKKYRQRKGLDITIRIDETNMQDELF